MTDSPRETTTAFAEVLTPCPVDNQPVDHVPLKTQEETNRTSDADAATEKKEKQTPVAFGALYRYATPLDKLCLILGILCAVVSGALFPCMALVFGKAISAFQQADGGVDTARVHAAALDYLTIALALFVADYGSYVLLSTTAERQMKTLRLAALRHLLYMDIAWYDAHDAMQLPTRLTGDTVQIKDGMGAKLGEAIKYASQFVAGYAIGLVKGWDTALVMGVVMPAMALSLGYLMAMFRVTMVESQRLYAEGGAIAEETLGAIRTVASLTAERRAIDAFHAKCLAVEALNLRLVTRAGVVIGLFTASTWLMYAAGLWYGGYKVSQAEATPMDVFQGFFGVLLGTIAIAVISPSLQAVAEACGAATALYEILDTTSAIDASRESDGLIPTTCAGRIEAVDLHFAYPTRRAAPILQGFHLTVAAGETVAFVGASGGGKSTLVALLERYYDPQRGQLRLDGRDIRSLNLKWLRKQIGVVSQEPVLFAQTIVENIVAGGDGGAVTREQAIAAAKSANAHQFIMTLPQQYETLVGEKGVSLSGGQKQRIAIARAIVRDPTILVLDEATSALDAESERAVQQALDDLLARSQRTTLVIAHRLSTVRRADKIVVLSGGRVVEEGTHDTLVAVDGGVYHNLYTIQDGAAEQEQDEPRELPVPATASTSGSRTMAHRHDSTRSSRSGDDGAARSSPLVELIDDSDRDKEPKAAFTVLDAMALSRPERKVFCVGLLASAIMGFAMPGSALLISQLLSAMIAKYAAYESTGSRVFLDDLYQDVASSSGVYLGSAAAVWAVKATTTMCFRFMAHKLTTRVRVLQFAALVRQNVAFFDDQRHATGALTAELATHATHVAHLSGDTLGRLLECFFTFAAAMAISFTLGSWLLSLVLLGIFPLLVATEAIRSRAFRKTAAPSEELAAMGARASEVLGNMRTVVALGLEDRLCGMFDALLDKPLAAGHKDARMNGLAFGFGSFIVFATYSLVFWYGGQLVHTRDISFLEMMRSLMAVMMSAHGVGIAASFLGDSENARQAGAAVTALCERVLPIDSFDESGERPVRVDGKIEFRDVTFAYPSRPGVTVLQNFNLTIAPGQTVAFCGPSGGGKSTCIALLERFYDPAGGHVLLDGRDLKDLNLRWLRTQLALVGQEPTLFIGTIAQNIAYGLETAPSYMEIEAAAKTANAHDFIVRFPDGYETQVGMQGEQLSGGQKQRIAIARAVLKNANVLLLDEATSALDSESEKTVQQALDNVVALQKCTTIIIAHRLSTIRTADTICVVRGGQIAEQGTHAELLAQNGIYTKLVASATTTKCTKPAVQSSLHAVGGHRTGDWNRA